MSAAKFRERQRAAGYGVTTTALSILVVSWMFPPWVYTTQLPSGRLQTPARYALIFAPPEPRARLVTQGVAIDVDRLSLQTAALSIIAVAGYVLVRRSQRPEQGSTHRREDVHPLGRLGHQIREQWEVNRPTMVSVLRAEGVLDTYVAQVEAMAHSVEASAIRSGLSHDQARELSRDVWALRDEEDEPQIGSARER
jgi:hypothetical protein